MCVQQWLSIMSKGRMWTLLQKFIALSIIFYFINTEGIWIYFFKSADFFLLWCSFLKKNYVLKIIQRKIMPFHEVWRFPSTLLKHTGAFIIRGQITMTIIHLGFAKHLSWFPVQPVKFRYLTQLWKAFHSSWLFSFVLEWLLQFLFGCLKPNSAF